MKKISKCNFEKKRIMAADAALGIAFADFDPSTPLQNMK
ncbi:MAG: hypothetical protein K0S25_1979 [Bacillus sp. (in: firmicutes)]|nr:hypothetical protein [Bacillus sp. (in: firmicutes)]